MKLFNVPASGMPGFPVHLVSELGLAATLETFGGLAIMLGLFTRPVAFVLAGEMAVAYFQMHFPRGFFPAVNGGMPAVLFCFLYLYLSFAGGGAWSLDAWLRSRREGRPITDR
jgi:putative oxidoreductase